METDSQHYVILSHTIPSNVYSLGRDHNLRPVKTKKRMFEGYGGFIPHHMPAIMALSHIDSSSDTIWKNLVMFHSFLCDDPETYDYAERSWTKIFDESELSFVCNESFFFETIDIGNKQNPKLIKRKRSDAIDFDHFPIRVYPTIKEESEREFNPTIGMNLSFSQSEEAAEETAPVYEMQVNYKKAFQLFCNLKKLDKKLFDQIRLYVFAGNIKEFHEVYHNDNASIAFYFSILESQAGSPAICRTQLKCDVCHRDYSNHGTSIEEHFKKTYGDSFNDLRKIRHRFFHQGEYSSFADEIWNIYDERQTLESSAQIDRLSRNKELDQREEKQGNLDDEVERLQTITRKTLIESFVHHYRDLEKELDI